MRKVFNICNFYILIWVLYFFHWRAPSVFPLFDALSNVFLALGLILSIYYFIVANVYYKLPRLYKVLNILLLLFLIYGLFSIIKGDVIIVSGYTQINNGSYLIGPLRSFLPFYAFYVFFQKGALSEKGIFIWTIIMFVQIVFCFFRVSLYRGIDIGETVNGITYSLVILLPYLFLIKTNNKALSFFLLLVLLYLILLGLKRGAILTSVIFAVYFVYVKMKSSSRWGKIGVTLLILIAISISINTVSEIYQNNAKFQQRIESTAEGNSSGRDQIFSSIWYTYTMKSNFGQLLFGYGADGSIKEVGIYAHNDWFEMLIDMGLLGVFVYGLFWTVFFIEWRKHKLDKDKLVYYILGGMLIVMLPRTFFSMVYSHLEITAGMLFSYCIFLSKRNNLPRIETKSDNQLKS